MQLVASTYWDYYYDHHLTQFVGEYRKLIAFVYILLISVVRLRVHCGMHWKIWGSP